MMALETVTRGDSYNHRCIAMTSGKIQYVEEIP